MIKGFKALRRRYVDRLSLGVTGPQNDYEMVCHDTANITVLADVVLARPSGILPSPEVLTAGDIFSAVASVLAEEKDKDKRKMNVIYIISLNLQQKMDSQESLRILTMYLIFF